jgi:hypothetical protein
MLQHDKRRNIAFIKCIYIKKRKEMCSIEPKHLPPAPPPLFFRSRATQSWLLLRNYSTNEQKITNPRLNKQAKKSFTKPCLVLFFCFSSPGNSFPLISSDCIAIRQSIRLFPPLLYSSYSSPYSRTPLLGSSPFFFTPQRWATVLTG